MLFCHCALTYSDTTSGSAFGMELIVTFIITLVFFALMGPANRFPGSIHISSMHFGASIALVHLIAVWDDMYVTLFFMGEFNNTLMCSLTTLFHTDVSSVGTTAFNLMLCSQ